MAIEGYINYYETLDLEEGANPGEVRKTYKRKIKALVGEIARVEITADRRSRYLLDMAQLNAAVYILRDKEKRDVYWRLRQELIDLETKWIEETKKSTEAGNELRRAFDGKVRYFLSKYVEETMLEAGRDKECFENSHWDPAHERYAFRILRNYRHGLYHQILQRLPFYEVTEPEIDWAERAQAVAGLLSKSTP